MCTPGGKGLSQGGLLTLGCQPVPCLAGESSWLSVFAPSTRPGVGAEELTLPRALDSSLGSQPVGSVHGSLVASPTPSD